MTKNEEEGENEGKEREGKGRDLRIEAVYRVQSTC